MNRWLALALWSIWIGAIALLCAHARPTWMFAVWIALGLTIGVLALLHRKTRASGRRLGAWPTVVVVAWLLIGQIMLLPETLPIWSILVVALGSVALMEIQLWKDRRGSSPDGKEPPSP